MNYVTAVSNWEGIAKQETGRHNMQNYDFKTESSGRRQVEYSFSKWIKLTTTLWILELTSRRLNRTKNTISCHNCPMKQNSCSDAKKLIDVYRTPIVHYSEPSEFNSVRIFPPWPMPRDSMISVFRTKNPLRTSDISYSCWPSHRPSNISWRHGLKCSSLCSEYAWSPRPNVRAIAKREITAAVGNRAPAMSRGDWPKPTHIIFYKSWFLRSCQNREIPFQRCLVGVFTLKAKWLTCRRDVCYPHHTLTHTLGAEWSQWGSGHGSYTRHPPPQASTRSAGVDYLEHVLHSTVVTLLTTYFEVHEVYAIRSKIGHKSHFQKLVYQRIKFS